ncbi:MAG: hypothetical protein OXF27_20815 [Acidobacteria bacterium]|nr:hypothetical protein [Acidobacteriota bacterium]MCY4602352.1 hypothetical protein [Acidobacteriota bacterium]
MDVAEISRIAIGTLLGLAISTGFLLALFVGFLVIAGFTKHRSRSRGSAIVRNIAERLGTGATYLPPSAPRGPADQLRTPELVEQSDRNQ